jgi:hypothetical protein
MGRRKIENISSEDIETIKDEDSGIEDNEFFDDYELFKSLTISGDEDG